LYDTTPRRGQFDRELAGALPSRTFLKRLTLIAAEIAT
jgi:hypothetical protein